MDLEIALIVKKKTIIAHLSLLILIRKAKQSEKKIHSANFFLKNFAQYARKWMHVLLRNAFEQYSREKKIIQMEW